MKLGIPGSAVRPARADLRPGTRRARRPAPLRPLDGHARGRGGEAAALGLAAGAGEGVLGLHSGLLFTGTTTPYRRRKSSSASFFRSLMEDMIQPRRIRAVDGGGGFQGAAPNIDRGVFMVGLPAADGAGRGALTLLGDGG